MLKILKLLLNYYNKFFVTKIGPGSDLFCRLDIRNTNAKLYIGDNCLINGRLCLEDKSSVINIHNNVFIGGATILDCKESIIIEDNVLISYQCLILDHDSHDNVSLNRINDTNLFRNRLYDWSKIPSKPVLIKKNSWIGARSIILKGVTVGEGSIVASGSVVTKNVEDYTLVAGNPAVFKKRIT